MQIAGKDADALADGSGMAPISWVSKELLKTSYKMNPAIDYVYDFRISKGWTESSGSINNSTSSTTWNARNSFTDNTHVIGKMIITAIDAGKISISAHTRNGTVGNKITCIVDGEELCIDYSSSKYVTKEIEVVEGQEITVDVDYLNANAKDGDWGQINIKGKCSYVTTSEDSMERYEKAYVDGTGTVGGWEKTEMRSYIKETIKQLIPETVRAHIKTVTKNQLAYNTSMSSFNQNTEDDLWIPEYKEINGGIYRILFPDYLSRKKEKVGGTSGVNWWLRSAKSNKSFSFVYLSGATTSSEINPNTSAGVCLCFCT